MADRGDTHYHVPTLNRWFLFSSVFFTLTMVWTVLDDASAEWKDHQREFRSIELRQARESFERLEGEGLVDLQEELQAKVDEAQAALDRDSDRISQLETAVYETKEEHYNREQVFKAHTAQLKWDVYQLEEERAALGPAGPSRPGARAETRAGEHQKRRLGHRGAPVGGRQG